MNWTELRVKLKKKYGSDVSWYNDKRTVGRRVKIWGVKQSELKEFISQQDESLNVKEYNWKCGMSSRKCVTVNFSE